MEEIFARMDPEQKMTFDRGYIEELYQTYQAARKGRAL